MNPQKRKQFLFFGYGFGVIIGVWSIRHWFKAGLTPGTIMAGVLSAAFFAGMLCCPKLMEVLFKGWMRIAFYINKIVTTVILFITYFFVFTPIGWLRKFKHSDPLELKVDKKCLTYWQKRPEHRRDRKSYNRQF